MCFHSKQTQTAVQLENRFKAKFVEPNSYSPAVYNGFQFPRTPVITNNEPQSIQMVKWGLIPKWAQDTNFAKNTLNARIETINEKPSFKNYVEQRCLVLCDGFFEWQWLDSAGKKKQKYSIGLPEGEPFGFAGLWNVWTDKSSGEMVNTYTILTTEANELMSEIHNTKKRMPILIARDREEDWLSGNNMITQNDLLVAEKMNSQIELEW